MKIDESLPRAIVIAVDDQRYERPAMLFAARSGACIHRNGVVWGGLASGFLQKRSKAADDWSASSLVVLRNSYELGVEWVGAHLGEVGECGEIHGVATRGC